MKRAPPDPHVAPNRYVAKVAALVRGGAVPAGATFFVPASRAADAYAACFAALGVECWRTYDCATRLRLPGGCYVLDAAATARVDARRRSLWDFDTPPAAAFVGLRAALAGLGAGAAGGDVGLYCRRDGHRAVRGEAALVDALRASTPGLAWVVHDGTGALADQAALFRRAAIVVAPHGAALANLVFARAGARVLELPVKHHANKVYKHAAAALGLPYRAAKTCTSLYTGTYDVGERELAEIVGLVGELLDGS